MPPRTKTFPFASRMALWPIRVVLMLPEVLKPPEASNNSANSGSQGGKSAASALRQFQPPTVSTSPLASAGAEDADDGHLHDRQRRGGCPIARGDHADHGREAHACRIE